MKVRWLLLAFAMIWMSLAFAAEISNDAGFITIQGRIEKGDAERFSKAVNAMNKKRLLQLNSLGGDVEVAMQIGRIARSNDMSAFVMPGSKCASSCVFILAGAVSRHVWSDSVVIHRPFWEGESKSAEEYDNRYKRMVASLKEYVTEMNVPVALIDRMMTIPPHHGEVLSEAELATYMLEGIDPAHEQEALSRIARERGISVTELNKRRTYSESMCGTAGEQSIYRNGSDTSMGDLDFFLELGSACREALLRGVAPEVVRERIDYVMKFSLHDSDTGDQVECLTRIIIDGQPCSALLPP